MRNKIIIKKKKPFNYARPPAPRPAACWHVCCGHWYTFFEQTTCPTSSMPTPPAGTTFIAQNFYGTYDPFCSATERSVDALLVGRCVFFLNDAYFLANESQEAITFTILTCREPTCEIAPCVVALFYQPTSARCCPMCCMFSQFCSIGRRFGRTRRPLCRLLLRRPRPRRARVWS